MAFLGEITNKRLNTILRHRHLLVLCVIKSLLGEGFIMADNRYHVNSNISSMFLAISLDRGLRKFVDKNVSKEVFKKEVLYSLDDVLRNYDFFWIPLPKDFEKNEEIPKLPIIPMDVKDEHRDNKKMTIRSLDFLMNWTNIVENVAPDRISI